MIIQFRPCINYTSFHGVQQAFTWVVLVVKGVVAFESGVSPRNEVEVNDRDQFIFEKLKKMGQERRNNMKLNGKPLVDTSI